MLIQSSPLFRSAYLCCEGPRPKAINLKAAPGVALQDRLLRAEGRKSKNDKKRDCKYEIASTYNIRGGAEMHTLTVFFLLRSKFGQITTLPVTKEIRFCRFACLELRD